MLPTGEWVRLSVGVGGICGSDLHLFAPASEGSPTLRGIADFPFELGHEIAGTIIEVGDDCPFAAGTRVAIDPTIPCLPRGIDPPCANCSKGWASSCLNFDSHVMTGGRALGTRGGWAPGGPSRCWGTDRCCIPSLRACRRRRPASRAALDRPARSGPPSAGSGGSHPHCRGRHHRPYRPPSRAGLLPGQRGGRFSCAIPTKLGLLALVGQPRS